MLRPLRTLAPLLLLAAAAAAAGDEGGPRYTQAGDLVAPSNYRDWVFLSSGLNMSYTDKPAAAGHDMFDNVFVEPAAWQAFKRSGHWPDRTMLVLEVRGAKSHGSINKSGQFQTGDLMGIEVHVRDEQRFKGGWGFFDVDGASDGKFIPLSAPCYACHQAHGTVDTTFTQFYPVAKEIAVKAGTYRERE